MIIVNASGDHPGQVERIHRVLDQRGMLFHVDPSLEATLEGRSLSHADLDLIRHAYASADFTTALKVIAENEQSLMARGGADLTLSLSTLAGWRGLIAAADDKDDESLRQFRAAIRFNPAYEIDKKLPSPKVKATILKAHRELDATGVLRAAVEPGGARIAVDGNVQKVDARSGGDGLRLPLGLHLVQISAPQRKSHAEIVDIAETRPITLDVALDPESTADKAIKLVDECAAAPSGAARLERARALSKLVGVDRLLFVEGASDEGIQLRLYDASHKKISKVLTLAPNDSSPAIASQIKAALDPELAVDTLAIGAGPDGVPGPPDEARWYDHWWVWAGAAVIVGGLALTYSYESRDPTTIKGF